MRLKICSHHLLLSSFPAITSCDLKKLNLSYSSSRGPHQKPYIYFTIGVILSATTAPETAIVVPENSPHPFYPFLIFSTPFFALDRKRKRNHRYKFWLFVSSNFSSHSTLCNLEEKKRRNGCCCYGDRRKRIGVVVVLIF